MALSLNLTSIRRRAGRAASPPQALVSGVVPLDREIVYLSVTGTVGYTVPDGQYVGQRLTLVCTVAASTPVGTVTITSGADAGANVIGPVDDVGQCIELQWTGTFWAILSLGGIAGTMAVS